MGAAQRVMDLVFVIVWGISQAVTPLVGINLGAGKYDRVKSILKWFFIYSTAACILTEATVFVLSKKEIYAFTVSLFCGSCTPGILHMEQY